jgi:hypothetical protein
VKILPVALASLCAWASAHGAERLPATLEACAALSRDTERLACYDRAVADLKAGKTDAPVSAENMFGATPETAAESPESRGIKREELRQISGIVTSVRPVNDGMILIELDNGQVWRQQDSDTRLMVATGDRVTVVRASMGTFRIADKTGRFARFKRVR